VILYIYTGAYIVNLPAKETLGSLTRLHELRHRAAPLTTTTT